ncbi:MAG: hypothetical protein JW715_10790 [Sedimentisphaerales bacterium]|nr:hypothetical protein [Sedimentisphaerales bacterium]
MKVKLFFYIVLIAFYVGAADSTLIAASTYDIDIVRDKAVLNDQDRSIIDNFLARAIGDFLTTKDFTSIAKLRTIIVNRQKSNQSEQNQYASQYSQSARKYISEAFEQARILRPPERQTRVIVNLLILIDSLQDLNLAELAVSKLADENMAIRYWAVHAVTNTDILRQLNSGNAANQKLARDITEQLKKIVDSSSPEILNLIAQFATALNIQQAEELLLQIADLRIQRYADWSVKYERLDITILKLLSDKINAPSRTSIGSTDSGKPAAARRFGQLYSYVIERFIKGRNLNLEQRQQLMSIMAEIEEKCIGVLMNDRNQNGIRTAIAGKDMNALEAERKRLLGEVLPDKLGFDYGTDSNGSKRTAPVTLPAQTL